MVSHRAQFGSFGLVTRTCHNATIASESRAFDGWKYMTRPIDLRGSTRASRSNERGVAMVEAAIVTPLLLMLLFGIIEFGFMFKDTLTLANSSRAGSRMASAAAVDPLADYFVLQAIKGASGTFTAVQQVIVFKATSPTSAVPGSCLTGAVAGLCNVYNQTDLSISQATFQGAGYTKDDFWAAPTRVTSIRAVGGPDYLGVYVKAQHDSVFQIIVPSRTLTDTTIMRLEPTR